MLANISQSDRRTLKLINTQNMFRHTNKALKKAKTFTHRSLPHGSSGANHLFSLDQRVIKMARFALLNETIHHYNKDLSMKLHKITSLMIIE